MGWTPFRSCPPSATQAANRTNRPDFSGQGSAPQPPLRQQGRGSSLPPSRDDQSLLLNTALPSAPHAVSTGLSFRYSLGHCAVFPRPIGSALGFKPYLLRITAQLTQSPPLPVSPGATLAQVQRFPSYPTTSAAVRQRPPVCVFVALARFRRVEIPKHLVYSHKPSSAYRLPDPQSGTGTAPYPSASILSGTPLFRYTLELSRDPPSLRSVVPTSPDFSLRTCRISAASPAQVWGSRSTIARHPRPGFAPVRC